MIIRIPGKAFELSGATQADTRYCYTLSERTAAQYSNDKRTYQKFAAEFHPSDAYIVRYRGRRIGYLEFQEKEDGWYLWDIHLSRNYQRQGLGAKLLEFVHKEVVKKGGSEITLFAYAKNPAIRLYKRFGYLVTKRILKDHRVRMMKHLR